MTSISNDNAPSFRIVLWRKDSQAWALALDRALKIEFVVVHDSEETALRMLDVCLPQEASIHVLASPTVWSQNVRFRNRKIIHISRQSQLKDYEAIEEYLKNPPTLDEVLKKITTTLYSLSDKSLIKVARKGLTKELCQFWGESDERINFVLKKASQPEKLLLHVCCGPDAAGVVRQLKNEFDLTCFWYDPNIQPQQEHDKRLDAFKKVMEIENIPYIVGEYDVQNFYDKIKGLEHTPEQGAKCSKCYDMRLLRAAHEAKEGQYDLYATTLAISPHKVQEKLIAFGELNERRLGVPYMHRNFMKDDGFKDSVAYTNEHNIYRQDYCGCYFSLHEGGPAAQWLGEQLNVKEKAPELIAPSKIFEEYESRVEKQDPHDAKG